MIKFRFIRIDKILLSFVLLSFCLLTSVSFAFVKDEILTSVGTSRNTTISSIGTVTTSTLYTAANNKINNLDDNDIDIAFNQLIQEIYNSTDYNSYVIYSYSSATSPENLSFDIWFFNSDDVNFGIVSGPPDGTKFFLEISRDSTVSSLRYYNSTGTQNPRRFTYSNGVYYNPIKFTGDIRYLNTSPNLSIYNLVYSSSQNGYYWDGSYYGQEPEEPDEPIMPTNSEIAQAVQAFYDSDYYKNNTDFKDFLVMYNYNTQYFSFIGHNYEDKFQQLIFPAGYKYNQQWWKFGLDGLTTELSSYIFDKYYWLYSTNDFGENFSYNGKGLLSNLLELNFSTSSTIVYSTNEYDVVVYSYNENNELTSEMDTMPGDQYTYDENLDPTTNEYNPLENFIPTNPSQSILGDVDFNEINKVFEENKDILNIENASWLFTANNELVGYFIGFLSLLIVFLIISRILGG